MWEETFARKWTIITAGLLLLMSLSGIFVVPIEPITENSDDGLSEEQVRALEELPASAKVSGRNGSTSSWAVKTGGSDNDDGRGIAVDSSGNAYVTGGFYETATFGTTNLTSSGGSDIFIAKLSSSGLWQWAFKAGGLSHDWGYGIAVDSSGNAYATGVFKGTATFGSTNLTATNTDTFTAKLSSNGSWQWAANGGGSSSPQYIDYNERGGIAVDSIGNIYVTGSFSETATFGNTSLTSSGYDDIFVAKLSASGSWQWAVKAGGSSQESSGGIAVDSSGNSYVTGDFSETATFGSTSLSSDYGDYNIFIAKLSSSGSWEWAVKAGYYASQEWDRGNGIAVDSSGNVYATGYFSGRATFGNTGLRSSGGYDIFIAKLNNSGSWQWAVKAGSTGDDRGHGIAVDSSGNAYATGFFRGTATFGTTNLTSSGGSDIFIAKLNSSGSWQWAVKAGGPDWVRGIGIAVDSSGNTYSTGVFKSTAIFGSTNLTSSGDYDIFIAKLSSSDEDMDGVEYTVDQCPDGATNWRSNSSTDIDNDGCRDSDEDLDDDNDGLLDDNDACPKGTIGPHPLGQDRDNDGCNDLTEDDDDDNDGWLDDEDNCPSITNQNQTDTDGDEIGDVCDPDDDNDGWLDDEDNCPSITNQNQTDTDGDEIGDVCDPDDDNDGLLDDDDDCPLHDQTTDSNCNGITNLDEDSDSDGIVDYFDQCEGHDDEIDTDNNGIPDGCEEETQTQTNTTNSTDTDGFDSINQTSPEQPDNNSNQQDGDSTKSSNELEFGKYGLLIAVVILVSFTIVIFVKRKETTVQVDDIEGPVEKYAQQLIAQGYEPEYARTYAEHFYAHNK